MKIINLNPIFDLTNHGFVYLCLMEDDSYWIRSVSGKWTQVKTSSPMDLSVIQNDLDLFIKSGVLVTENDVKVDNASQIIVDPAAIAISIVP